MFQQRDMKVLDWVLFYVLMAIPFVNIIVVLVLIFSSKTSPSLKSFIITFLIFAAILLVSWVAILGTLIASFNQS